MPMFFSDSGSFNHLQVTGSTTLSGSANVLTVIGSGSAILAISGSQGPIFSINDNASSTELFAVATGSTDILTISNTKVVSISGSLVVTGSITGSLSGTATTASYVLGSNVAGNITGNAANITAYTINQNLGTANQVTFAGVTASLFGTATTASYVKNAQTASYVLQAVSASYATTASYVALAQTASYVVTAQTASYYGGSVTSASYASTASYVTLAQTASYVQTAQTASYYGGSVTSASYAATASLLLGTVVSASYSITSSYASTAQTLLGSVESASYAATASLLLGTIESASYALTASYVPGATNPTLQDVVNNGNTFLGTIIADASPSSSITSVSGSTTVALDFFPANTDGVSLTRVNGNDYASFTHDSDDTFFSSGKSTTSIVKTEIGQNDLAANLVTKDSVVSLALLDSANTTYLAGAGIVAPLASTSSVLLRSETVVAEDLTYSALASLSTARNVFLYATKNQTSTDSTIESRAITINTGSIEFTSELGTALTFVSTSIIVGTNHSITGSLYGTASWAENVVSASYATTASYALTVETPPAVNLFYYYNNI